MPGGMAVALPTRLQSLTRQVSHGTTTFQRTLDILLSRYKWRTCLVYLDDVIIFSNNLDDHLSHLEQVLTALSQAGISIKLTKCEFFTREVKYLGHFIRPGTLVEQWQTIALRKAKHPKTQTELIRGQHFDPFRSQMRSRLNGGSCCHLELMITVTSFGTSSRLLR